MSFLKNLVTLGKSAAKTAAPMIANAFVPGSGAAVSMAENKMSRKPAAPGSASSIGEARSQDRARMSTQYPGSGPMDL